MGAMIPSRAARLLPGPVLMVAGAAVAAATPEGHAALEADVDGFDCEHGAEDEEEQGDWTDSERDWCCEHRGFGCSLYDCLADEASAELWTQAQIDWCCEMEGVACPSSSGSSVSERDCLLTTVAWTPEKQYWCCINEGLGCGPESTTTTSSNTATASTTTAVTGTSFTTTSSPAVFDCEEGSFAWADTWSSEQVSWCCTNAGRGCDLFAKAVAKRQGELLPSSEAPQASAPTFTVTTTVPPSTGTLRTTTTTTPTTTVTTTACEDTAAFAVDNGGHSCSDGYNDYPLEYCGNYDDADFTSDSMCCACGGGGSAQDTTGTTIGTTLSTATSAPTSTRTFSSSTLVTTGTTPPSTTTTASLTARTSTHTSTTRRDLESNTCGTICSLNGTNASCGARIQHLADTAFAGQPEACASAHGHVSRSCPACSTCPLSSSQCIEIPGETPAIVAPGAAQGKPFDCEAEPNVRGWALEKKEWCCEHERLGCLKTKGTSSFNCTAGVNNWDRGWSSAKKDWCCEREGLGCDGRTDSVVEAVMDKYYAPTTDSQFGRRRRPGSVGTSLRGPGAECAATVCLAFAALLLLAAAAHWRFLRRPAAERVAGRFLTIRSTWPPAGLAGDDVGPLLA